MRPYLLEFLMQMHYQLKLTTKSFYTGINIIDKYCSKRVVKKSHYQLVGLTSLFIASKIDDDKNKVITIKELIVASREAYDESLFLKMELHILSTLEWNISDPTIFDCLELSLVDESSSSDLYQVAQFVGQLCLYDRSLMFFPNHIKSIVIILLAHSILNTTSSYTKNFKLDLFNLGSNNDFEFKTPFFNNLDSNSISQFRKVSLLMINLLVNRFNSNSLKIKFARVKITDKIENFTDKFVQFIKLRNLDVNFTLGNLESQFHSLNANKLSPITMNFKNLFPDAYTLLTNFALGIDTSAVIATISDQISGLDLIDSHYCFDISCGTTPVSANSTVPSLESSRSNSAASISSGDTSFDYYSPIKKAPFMLEVSPYSSPKILNFNNSQKLNLLLTKQNKASTQGLLATKDPIKERKRCFEDQQLMSQKRHSPNLKENYAFQLE